MKILDRLGIVFDMLKATIIGIIVIVLIICLFGSIVHNVLKLSYIENKYTGQYKNTVEINDKKMNVYSIGQGDKTIVILSGFGIQSPVLEYKALADALSQNYKVIILEYFGYGFSSKTDDERTNENIVKEIRQALKLSGNEGPYVLMPHSISNLYALKYSQSYPEEVQAIISLDGLFPVEIKTNTKEEDYIFNLESNTKFAWILEKIGYARLTSYSKPEMFRIDKMKNKLNYSDEDIKLYRTMIANTYLTKNMMNEIKNLKNNINELDDFKYSENLPVLNLLANETLDLNEYTDNLNSKIEKLFTNKSRQLNLTIVGTHYLEIDNIEDIVKYTNIFLNQI